MEDKLMPPPIIHIPVSTEEAARERYRKARHAILEARVAFANNPCPDTSAAIEEAKRELTTASIFTHDE